MDFWEDYYSKHDEAFDWLIRWESPTENKPLKDLLYDQTPIYETGKDGKKVEVGNKSMLKEEMEILIIGCGTSRLSEELCDEGFEKVTSIDFSSTAIKLQKERYLGQEDYKELEFVEMDARKLQFPDGKFDVVIDKGLMDSMLCSNPGPKNVQDMLENVHRVLNETGKYICISREVEAKRKQHMKKVGKFNWKVQKCPIIKPIAGPLPARMPRATEIDDKKYFLFVYIC